MTGLPLFDEAAKRDLAIEQVERNNLPPVDRAVLDAIAILDTLPTGAEVASDQLVPDLDKYGFTDNRAVGPVMRRLVKKRVIKVDPLGRFRPSDREGNHRVPIRIYINLR